MEIMQKYLIPIDAGECVLKIDLSGADRFDLSALQFNAAFPFIREEIIPISFFVGRYSAHDRGIIAY
jgi:hypothetical protein